jgi:uncharacterized protein YneF (UPF0154 family)
MNIAIPIITFVIGAAIGFAAGVYYLRSQLTKMQNDPDTMRQMAKQMGYNLNKNQMNQMQKMMNSNKKRFK